MASSFEKSVKGGTKIKVAMRLPQPSAPTAAADQERRKKHPPEPFAKDRMPRDPVVLRGLPTNDHARATTAASAPEGPRV